MNRGKADNLTWLRCALHERISCETTSTSAHGRVTDSATLSISATGTRTRVLALLVYASLLRWAFSVAHALRLAIRRRSYEF